MQRIHIQYSKKIVYKNELYTFFLKFEFMFYRTVTHIYSCDEPSQFFIMLERKYLYITNIVLPHVKWNYNSVDSSGTWGYVGKGAVSILGITYKKFRPYS